jgi:hypothetical protein
VREGGGEGGEGGRERDRDGGMKGERERERGMEGARDLHLAVELWPSVYRRRAAHESHHRVCARARVRARVHLILSCDESHFHFVGQMRLRVKHRASLIQ